MTDLEKRSPSRRAPAILALLSVVALLSVALHVSADEVTLDLATKILLKVVLLDEDLERKSDNALVIGVLGSDAAFKAFSELKGQKLDRGKKIRISDVVQYDSVPSPSALPTFLFVGARANPEEVVAFTRRHKVLSVTTVDGYVKRGVTLGLTVEDQRPKVLLNLIGSEAEGLRWNSKILKISRVIR